MITRNNAQRGAQLLSAIFVLGVGGSLAANAQTTRKHHGFLHRHAGAIAGVSAYEAAKHTGHSRKMNGQHRNFAQRHPFITGAAVGGVTHHYAKKH